MRKNYDINSFYYFNKVLDFNWLGVRMMSWVRVQTRISQYRLCSVSYSIENLPLDCWLVLFEYFCKIFFCLCLLPICTYSMKDFDLLCYFLLVAIVTLRSIIFISMIYCLIYSCFDVYIRL